MMSELGGTRGGIARPVAAGVVHAIGVSPAVGLRARQHVVRVRHIANAVDRHRLLGERSRLGYAVADTRLVERIAMQVSHILSDSCSAGPVPRSGANAVTSIDGCLAS